MFVFVAKPPISALVFEIQLNIVVLPVLVKPMIPQFNAIIIYFLILAKIIKGQRQKAKGKRFFLVKNDCRDVSMFPKNEHTLKRLTN
jgi:hypothetical protein